MPGALLDTDVVSAWTNGRGRSSPERAVAMLHAALPDLPAGELEAAPIGIRDRWLLDLREVTFGPRIESVAACPRCEERLEASFDVADVRVPAPASPSNGGGGEAEVTVDGHRLTVRLPSTADLRAAAACRTEEEARRTLVARCVVAADERGRTVSITDISETIVSRAARSILERDPQADVRLRLTCPACSHEWEAEFDIASFLWEEIEARAGGLLAQVHLLARAYGWPESEILSLPEARRRAYLDLVMG